MKRAGLSAEKSPTAGDIAKTYNETLLGPTDLEVGEKVVDTQGDIGTVVGFEVDSDGDKLILVDMETGGYINPTRFVFSGHKLHRVAGSDDQAPDT